MALADLNEFTFSINTTGIAIWGHEEPLKPGGKDAKVLEGSYAFHSGSVFRFFFDY